MGAEFPGLPELPELPESPKPMTATVPPGTVVLTMEEVEELDALDARVHEAVAASRAPRTREEYAKGWAHFVAWVQEHVPGGEAELGPPTNPRLVARFLTNVETFKGEPPSLSILSLWRCAIDYTHKLQGLVPPGRDPLVVAAWDGVKRTYAAGGLGVRKASALTPEEVGQLVRACDCNFPAGRRDRAMVLIGWVGALRREELIELTWDAVRPDRDREGHQALLLDLRATKGDQYGVAGAHALPVAPGALLDPQAALEAWAPDVREVDGGLLARAPVFRAVNRWGTVSDHGLDPASVTRILGRIARRAGVSVERLTAHSLRAGGITAASDAGTFKMKELARHKRLDTTAGYYRPREQYQGLALRKVVEGETAAAPSPGSSTT